MINFILLCLITTIFASELFAGNGLQTYSYTILHNRIIQVNCTTYDDCHELLCSYLFQPIYLVTIDPNNWNGHCDNLNKTDDRLLDAEIDVYINGKFNKYYDIKTVSETSILLCALNKKPNITQIQYFIFNCTF